MSDFLFLILFGLSLIFIPICFKDIVESVYSENKENNHEENN